MRPRHRTRACLAACRTRPNGQLGLVEDGEARDDGDWTEAKNARRCALIDKEIAGTLSAQEAVELARLQRAMLRYRRQVAPLPLEDARPLHQELMAKARERADSG